MRPRRRLLLLPCACAAAALLAPHPAAAQHDIPLHVPTGAVEGDDGIYEYGITTDTSDAGRDPDGEDEANLDPNSEDRKEATLGKIAALDKEVRYWAELVRRHERAHELHRQALLDDADELKDVIADEKKLWEALEETELEREFQIKRLKNLESGGNGRKWEDVSFWEWFGIYDGIRVPTVIKIASGVDGAERTETVEILERYRGFGLKERWQRLAVFIFAVLLPLGWVLRWAYLLQDPMKQFGVYDSQGVLVDVDVGKAAKVAAKTAGKSI